MSERSWEHVKELFDAALEKEPRERTEFVRERAAGDLAFAAEVLSLLAAHDDEPSLLANPVFDRLAEFIHADPDGFKPGEVVSGLTLERRVASGGMGTIWRARHPRPDADGDTGESEVVAVKFIRRGIDSATVFRRFAVERKSLANLNHPNIARLLDGGVTKDGRPFLVMEFIDGERIDRYCDRAQLTIEQRVELFCVVSEAVHYAHRSLVVHRDLKPANILVTEAGVPKLLDFGIAKILDPNAADATLTAADTRPLTPQYASPEQVSGAPVTTATDVYSLGVVLYELLTGHRPYDVETAMRREIERVVTSLEPERPSLAVRHARVSVKPDGATEVLEEPAAIAARRRSRPEVLSRALAGDLDNIVLMAMRKEPERRYASPAQLVEDLHRWLRGMPVMAREDTVSYRFVKFVQRNRLAASIGGLLFLTLIAGIVVVRIQSHHVQREAEYAKSEAESLHRVVDFLIELFEVADREEAGAGELTARDLLERGMEEIPDRLRDQQGVRSALLLAMGRAFLQLGEFERAAPLLEEVAEIRDDLYGKEHPEVAEGMHSLGNLRRLQGRYGEAETLLQDARSMWARHWGELHLDVANATNSLALLYRELGRLPEAEALLRAVLAVRVELLGESHSDVQQARNNLAGVLYAQRRFSEATALLLAVVEQQRARYPGGGRKLATNLNNLALLLHEQGDLDAAEPLYAEALAMRTAHLPEEHPDLASSHNNLGGLSFERGLYTRAERRFETAIEIAGRAFGDPEHPVMAQYRMNLARTWRHAGRPAESAAVLEEMIAVQTALLPERHPLLYALHAEHAAACRALGQSAEAVASAREAHRLRALAFPLGHDAVRETGMLLGLALVEDGQHAAALETLAEALDALGAHTIREDLAIEAREALERLRSESGAPVSR